MRWDDIRQTYPDQWLVIEALEAHTEDHRRIFDRIAVLEPAPDGAAAFRRYRDLHRAHPTREICFAHTANAALEITERSWVGIRMSDEADTPR